MAKEDKYQRRYRKIDKKFQKKHRNRTRGGNRNQYSKGCLKFTLLPVGMGVLLLLTAAKCDPANQEPPVRGLTRYVVEHKRQPCGADKICQQKEVNCWQFQLHNELNGKTEYRCVPKAEWDKYMVGSNYP